MMALRQCHKVQQLVRGLFSCSSGSPVQQSGIIPLCLSSLPSGAPPTDAAGPTSVFYPAGVAAACWSPFRAYHNLPGLELPSRRGLFAELPLVSDMLPNRKHLAAQFSPHGLTLVPKAILVAAATAAASPVTAVHQEPTNPFQQTPMLAIGTKTWKRLKMKKHKIRKRRKESRMQVKKT